MNEDDLVTYLSNTWDYTSTLDKPNITKDATLLSPGYLLVQMGKVDSRPVSAQLHEDVWWFDLKLNHAEKDAIDDLLSILEDFPGDQPEIILDDDFSGDFSQWDAHDAVIDNGRVKFIDGTKYIRKSCKPISMECKYQLDNINCNCEIIALGEYPSTMAIRVGVSSGAKIYMNGIYLGTADTNEHSVSFTNINYLKETFDFAMDGETLHEGVAFQYTPPETPDVWARPYVSYTLYEDDWLIKGLPVDMGYVHKKPKIIVNSGGRDGVGNYIWNVSMYVWRLV